MAHSLFEQGVQKGIQIGIAQTFQIGFAQGIQIGQRDMLLHQLERRFGPLSDQVRQQLAALPPDRLIELGETVLTACLLENRSRDGDSLRKS